jgi:hypothetical protein
MSRWLLAHERLPRTRSGGFQPPVWLGGFQATAARSRRYSFFAS